jgi:hypothetical protein
MPDNVEMNWQSKCLTSFDFQEKSDQITNRKVVLVVKLAICVFISTLSCKNIIYE